MVEKSLNTPKVMVWAAVGVPGIIVPFFIEENVTGETYFNLLTEEFYSVFSSYPNASELPFMQDETPPHWFQRVRDLLNQTWLTVE